MDIVGREKSLKGNILVGKSLGMEMSEVGKSLGREMSW